MRLIIYEVDNICGLGKRGGTGCQNSEIQHSSAGALCFYWCTLVENWFMMLSFIETKQTNKKLLLGKHPSRNTFGGEKYSENSTKFTTAFNRVS